MGLQPWGQEFPDMHDPDPSDEAADPVESCEMPAPSELDVDQFHLDFPVETVAEPFAAAMIEQQLPVAEPLAAATGETCDATAPAVKRKRLTGKTPDDKAEPIAAASIRVPVASRPSGRAPNLPVRKRDRARPVDFMTASVDWALYAEEWPVKTGRQRYLLVHRKFVWWLEQWTVLIKQKDPSERTNDESQALAVFQSKTNGAAEKLEKNKLMHTFLELKAAPAWIMDFAVNQWPIESDANRHWFLNARSVLLTWQGDWGLLHALSSGEPFASDPELLAAQVQQDESVQQMFVNFKNRVQDIFQRLEATYYGASAELCLKTWAVEKKVRIHCHAFLLRKGGKKMNTRTPVALTFSGSMPNKRVWDGPQGRCRGTMAGLYYITARKYGSLCSFANLNPFLDFPVQSDWIFTLLESEKISYDNAREDLCRSPKGLVRKLADLDKWYEEKKSRARKMRIAARQEQLRRLQRPFKILPQVKAFLRKYIGSKPCERKKILVLTGPSGMGKTQYVRSLFPAGSLLELNAGSMKTICLPSWDEELHKAIFWDECSASLVSENRKLFQHTATLIDLGHSPTGQHIKHVWLNDAVSIIATNRWEEDVATLPSQSDKDWIHANTIVVPVLSPLFG